MNQSPAELGQEQQPPARKRRKVLSLTEQVLIRKAADRYPDKSYAQLGELLGLHRKVVSKVLKARDITAMDLLTAGQGQAARAWIRSIPRAAAKGDHRAARDLLLHTKAIEPLKTEQPTGITILFGIGLLPGADIHTPSSTSIEVPVISAGTGTDVPPDVPTE